MTAQAPEYVMWTHGHGHDLVDGRRERAGDSDEVLPLSQPFAIEQPIRDVTP